jgi:transcription elongation GreA/GreB family factor
MAADHNPIKFATSLSAKLATRSRHVCAFLGYEVKPQLGVAGLFIDMAVRNPDRPGEFLAGIECDGATYHSGFSVRDRDRIRREILESLGWKGRIHRIWSTDWFYNPRRETERLVAFLNERRLLSQAQELHDWEGEEREDDTYEPAKSTIALEELADAISSTTSREDVFAEIGDRITYCFLDEPDERQSVVIVDGASEPEQGIVNEYTPVALALIGLSPGDVGKLEIPGQRPCLLRILKIQRQDAASTAS